MLSGQFTFTDLIVGTISYQYQISIGKRNYHSSHTACPVMMSHRKQANRQLPGGDPEVFVKAPEAAQWPSNTVSALRLRGLSGH